MRILISALTVAFVVSFTPIREAADSHLIQNLILEQTKIVKDELNKLGPCKAMSGTLVWTCLQSKKEAKKNFKGSGKPITIDQLVYLGSFYKKLKENEQNKVVYPGVK